MNRILKIVWCVVFCTLIAMPLLYLFGVPGSHSEPPARSDLTLREKSMTVLGWERDVDIPSFTVKGFLDRSYQDTLAEAYSKKFFPRAAFLRTAYQLRELTNFGLFHYGYSGSILDGREGVLYERPYESFHLTCPRPGGAARYAEVLGVLKDMDAFCKSNGIAFVFAPMPDKPQLYPEFLPGWFDWFWNYSNYDAQAEVGGYVRAAGIDVFDPTERLLKMKAGGQWKMWVYPPYGTHFNAYGNGLIYNLFLDEFVDSGRIPLKSNRFTGIRPAPDGNRYKDDDISVLLNLWTNWRLARNPHCAANFETTNGVMNAGSVITVGDCYRLHAMRIMQDAHLFAWDKVFSAPRGPQQTPETYKPFAKDLKLVMVIYQSINTGQLDARRDELKAIFTALQTAVREAKTKDKENKS